MTFKDKLKKFFHCNNNKETEEYKKIKSIITREELLQKVAKKLDEVEALVNKVDIKDAEYLMSVVYDIKRHPVLTLLRTMDKKVSSYNMRKTPPCVQNHIPCVQNPKGEIGFTMKGVARAKPKPTSTSTSKSKSKSNKAKNNERRNNKPEGNTRGK